MKNIKLGLFIALLSAVSAVQGAVTIGHVQNSATGGFLDQASSSLLSGEVSVGFFDVAFGNPTQAQWDAIAAGPVSNAWSSLLSIGYKDVRNFGNLATGFDWSYASGTAPSSNIGGTVQNIPIASLAQNTRLYVLGFNGGTWDNTAKTATFSSATQWAAVSAFGHATTAQNFLSPADLGTKSITFKNSALTSSDVLVGTLVSSANGTVSMVPEPSSASLLMLGAAGLVALRRLRKV